VPVSNHIYFAGAEDLQAIKLFSKKADLSVFQGTYPHLLEIYHD
jgi:hypothetical protein